MFRILCPTNSSIEKKCMVGRIIILANKFYYLLTLSVHMYC